MGTDTVTAIETVDDSEPNHDNDRVDINVIDDINIDVEELPATNTASTPGIEARQDASKRDGKLREAPTQAQSLDALGELKAKLCPPNIEGTVYCPKA
jgi:hypothetical protein